VHDGLQEVRHALAGLGADLCRAVHWDGQHLFHLARGGRHVGVGQVDLVQHRDEFEALVGGQVRVGHRLRLHPLGASTTSSAPSQAARLRATS